MVSLNPTKSLSYPNLLGSVSSTSKGSSTTERSGSTPPLLRRNKRSWYCGVEGSGPRKVQKVVSVAQDSRATISADLHPHQFLVKRLIENGIFVKVCGHDELNDFFQEPRAEEIDAYCVEVVEAVRQSDLDLLRKIHSQGRPLKCSNRFGESLLHLACRRQLIHVVDFLLNEAHVDPAVRDDYGRSPLHDACWTSDPNFELVDLLLARCPDLLYIKDRRGHTPLFYARQSHWGQWTQHLEGRIESLAPRCSALLSAR